MLSYIVAASLANALPLQNPTCGEKLMQGIAIIDVACEPKHPERWKNDKVRVFQVDVQPGENAWWHYHDRKTVLHIIRPTRLLSQGLGKQPAEAALEKSVVFPALPSIHRWTSLDSFYSVGIEILGERGTTADVIPGLAVVKEDSSYRAYEHKGDKAVSVSLANTAVVLMSDGCIKVNDSEKCGVAGDDVWIENGRIEASIQLSLIQIL
jgi:hypothetical protein